jgi:hypothetical protein
MTVTPGYYTAPAAGVVTNSTNTMGQRVECPPGYYCVGGVQTACPPGTFQSGVRKTSEGDCRVCPSGFYCPAGTAAPVPCGADDVYCPLGSRVPLTAGPGFFTDGAPGGRSTVEPCGPGSYCPGDGTQGVACACGCVRVFPLSG